MKMNLLFPKQSSDRKFSAFLLCVRILFGMLLITHGVMKINNYGAMSQGFADPFGIGSEPSLCLAIFAEVLCSVAFIFGFLFRLSTIPMIVTMTVAFFVAHGASIQEGELAFIYLLMFVFTYISGPGRYSIDYFIRRRIEK